MVAEALLAEVVASLRATQSCFAAYLLGISVTAFSMQLPFFQGVRPLLLIVVQSVELGSERWKM